MNAARTSESRLDIDLQKTRSAFLFAREQVASNSISEHYFTVRARGWAPHRAGRPRPATDTPTNRAG